MESNFSTAINIIAFLLHDIEGVYRFAEVFILSAGIRYYNIC